MPSILNSDDGAVSGTSGLKSTGGNDGLLNIQSNGSTVLAVTGSGIAVTGTMSQTGASTFAAGTAGAPSITFTGDTNTGIFSPAADTIAFSEGGAEAMRIDSSGNVGIGTSSPASLLHLKSATSGAPQLRIEGTGTDNGIITWLGSGHANPAVGIRYISTGDSIGNLAFYANGSSSATLTERARITSGGYFKATNDGAYIDTAGAFHEFRQTAATTEGLAVQASNASYTGAAFRVYANRNTTNNTFYAMDFYNSSAGAFKFRVADSGSISTAGSIQLGDAGAPPTSGVGVKFPAAQSASSDANTLDDYEEGTWTPTVKLGSTTNTGTEIGYYVKIGSVVYFGLTVINITKSGTGDLSITGLPFSALGSGNSRPDQSSICRWDGINTVGVIIPHCNNVTVYMQEYNTAGFVSSVTNVDCNATYNIYGVYGFYYTV